MRRCNWFSLLAGLTGGLLASRAWRLYDTRSRTRISGAEGLEDPAVAHAYGRIARTPQMGLLRRFAVRRAAALCATGAAADIGCGPGLLVAELTRQAPGLRVTGVDLSEEMLAQGRRHVARGGLADRADFRLGDAARLPFGDGSLDLVVSTLSLHHWDDPTSVFSEVARVLRPGGAFMIFDLRRDMIAPAWLLIWFATNVIVPRALRTAGEPLGSRNAAYTPTEAAALAQASRLTGWRVNSGPFWLAVEGQTLSLELS